MVEVDKKPIKVLITGASGFIGRALITSLSIKGLYNLSCLVRREMEIWGAHNIIVQSIENITEKENFLDGIDIIIHLAGIAHSNGEKELSFYNINTNATVNLALLAAKAGVKRFIFLSSIGVNGTSSDVPFSHLSETLPEEAYARSKRQAEIYLKEVLKTSTMKLVIIRPPLVYGKGAPGNFGKLVQLVKLGIPLPLGAVHSMRSFVALDNLISFIELCIHHPNAANRTFLISDDEDISLHDVLKTIGSECGKTVRLLPVPVNLLKVCASLIGKRAIVDRLCGQLQVDISFTKKTLGWVPIVNVKEGIRRCFTVKEEV